MDFLSLLDIGRNWSVGDFPGQFLSSHTRFYKNIHLKTAQDSTTFPPKTDNFLEKKCVCVCVKKEMNGAATAYWVEKDITWSPVFQNAKTFCHGLVLSPKARQALAY